MIRTACLTACIALMTALLAVLMTTVLMPGAGMAQDRDDGSVEDITSLQCWLPDATDGSALIIDMTSETKRPRQLYTPNNPGDVERQVFVFADTSLGINLELRVYSVQLGPGNTVQILCTVGLPR